MFFFDKISILKVIRIHFYINNYKIKSIMVRRFKIRYCLDVIHNVLLKLQSIRCSQKMPEATFGIESNLTTTLAGGSRCNTTNQTGKNNSFFSWSDRFIRQFAFIWWECPLMWGTQVFYSNHHFVFSQNFPASSVLHTVSHIGSISKQNYQPTFSIKSYAWLAD